MLQNKPPSSYRSRFHEAIEEISVELISTVDPYAAAKQVAVFAETTFGDPRLDIEVDQALRIAQQAAEFKQVIPNALETVSLTFVINGVSRATTHQLVRTRVGAGFGQFSQRANNISGFNFRVPATVAEVMKDDHEMRDIVMTHIDDSRQVYKLLIDSGVPWQDARYVVPEGCETSITATYNLLSLIGTLQRRLCNRMQWEINYVARLMADAVVSALPWLGLAFRTRCERSGRCQTIDPMFPPSCWWWNSSTKRSELVEDQPALAELLAADGYNWERNANAAYVRFGRLDETRVSQEANGDIVMSMVEPDKMLVVKNHRDGIWRKHG